jgi:hypothetical protein
MQDGGVNVYHCYTPDSQHQRWPYLCLCAGYVYAGDSALCTAHSDPHVASNVGRNMLCAQEGCKPP